MATYTFSILDVSKETFEEISKKLLAVNYDHAFHELKEGRVIDMHGIALKQEGADPLPKDEVLYERVEFTRTQVYKFLEDGENITK